MGDNPWEWSQEESDLQDDPFMDLITFRLNDMMDEDDPPEVLSGWLFEELNDRVNFSSIIFHDVIVQRIGSLIYWGRSRPTGLT